MFHIMESRVEQNILALTFSNPKRKEEINAACI